MSTLIRNGNKIGGAISKLEKFQIYELPTPSSTYAGKIYQYIGETNEAFINGFFYKCELNNNDNYVWREVKTSSIISDTGASTEFAYSSQRVQTLLDNKADTATTYSKIEVDSRISAQLSSALKYKGKVATVAALPVNVENGDSYIVEADDLLYAWNDDNSQWDALGGITDLTNYYTKTEVDQMFADMADKFQYSTMPTASSTTIGKVIQYIGGDTNDYKNCYWYKGVDNGDGTYRWELLSVGDYYTKSEIDGNFDKRIELTGAIDLNEYYANGKYIARNGSGYTVTNAPTDLPYPNNGFSLEVMSYGASDGNTDAFCTQMLTAYTSDTVWIRSRFWGSDWFRWTSWQKLATTDNIYKTVSTGSLTSAGGNHWFIVDNLYPSMGLQTATYVINGRNGGCYIMSCGTTDDANKIAPTIITISSGSNPLVGFNYDLATGKVELQSNQYNTLFITQISGVRNDFTIENETNTPQLSTVGAMESIATKDEIFHVGDRRDIIGWADLTSDVNVDGSSNYANNVGRIDGRNAMILVSNPTPNYQWPVTNSGDRNIFLDFGSYVQFFVDTVNNSLYVRARDSVDMGNWGAIATKNELKTTFALTRVDEHTCTFDLSALPYAENGLCVINLMGNWNLEGSAVCSIGYFEGAWRINSVTTLVDAGNVGTITASISGSTLTVSNTGVNYAGRLNVRVGQLF